MFQQGDEPSASWQKAPPATLIGIERLNWLDIPVPLRRGSSNTTSNLGFAVAQREINNACIHHNEQFYVGIGHPRCGTGYTADLLSKNGVDVGHEVVGTNGIVSWMLPGEKYNNPYYDALGPLARFNNIFLVARSPLDAIPSIIPENKPGPGLRFRRRILKERIGVDPIGPYGSSNDVRRAVASYLHWYELCLAFRPGVIFRVDRDDLTELSEFVGSDLVVKERINRNSRASIRDTSFVSADLGKYVPKLLLSRLADLCLRLGYLEEGEEVIRLSHGAK